MMIHTKNLIIDDLDITNDSSVVVKSFSSNEEFAEITFENPLQCVINENITLNEIKSIEVLLDDKIITLHSIDYSNPVSILYEIKSTVITVKDGNLVITSIDSDNQYSNYPVIDSLSLYETAGGNYNIDIKGYVNKYVTNRTKFITVRDKNLPVALNKGIVMISNLMDNRNFKKLKDSTFLLNNTIYIIDYYDENTESFIYHSLLDDSNKNYISIIDLLNLNPNFIDDETLLLYCINDNDMEQCKGYVVGIEYKDMSDTDKQDIVELFETKYLEIVNILTTGITSIIEVNELKCIMNDILETPVMKKYKSICIFTNGDLLAIDNDFIKYIKELIEAHYDSFQTK